MKRFYIALPILMLFSCGESSTESKSEEVECVTSKQSFKKDILPIFEANCFNCHKEENYASKADGNLMESYSDIKKLLDEGLVMGNIEHRAGFLKMPYRKGKIEDCDIAKIKEWVKDGALDN